MRLKPANIFIQENQQEYYSEIVTPPTHIQNKIYSYIIKNSYLPLSGRINILDIGVGAGDFLIPFLLYLRKEKIDFFVKAFDISKFMIEKLLERSKQLRLTNCLDVSLDDASLPLDKVRYPYNYFDYVIITFVLHYIPQWRRTIREAKYRLKKNGILIQAASKGFFNLLGGRFKELGKNNKLAIEFWKTFFLKKGAMGYFWKPQVDFTTLNDVRKYMAKIGFKEVGRMTFWWSKKYNLSSFLLWIEKSPLSSIGAGIIPEERQNLAIEMKKWLIEKGVSLNKEIQTYWGYEIFLHKK
jgi:ubiquinone/menaquinone biosynthesis C-methylase UbiE